MPIRVEWLVEGRVILSTFEDDVRSDEIEAWFDQQMQMVGQGKPCVHHITDSRRLLRIENVTRYRTRLAFNLPRSRDFGWHVEVSSRANHPRTSEFVPRFAVLKDHSYISTYDALEFLCDHDETLEELVYQKV